MSLLYFRHLQSCSALPSAIRSRARPAAYRIITPFHFSPQLDYMAWLPVAEVTRALSKSGRQTTLVSFFLPISANLVQSLWEDPNGKITS